MGLRFGKAVISVSYFETVMTGFDLGRYAPGYNPKVHGPYWPGRNYQSVDTKLMDVKLGELPSWLRRRPMGLRPLARVATQEVLVSMPDTIELHHLLKRENI